MTIGVAVSGGMDSLYALHFLHEEGRNVFAIHGRFLPHGNERGLQGLEEFCSGRSIPLHCIDLRAEFEQYVISRFCTDYLAGRTPNPCAHCNSLIKFGILWEAARDLGATRLATGHYARMRPHPLAGNALLPLAGIDAKKDQSYFLSLTPVTRLREGLFPLGDQLKNDIAAELARCGIVPSLPGESQDICFVPGNDYRGFLESRGISLPGPGIVEDAFGRLLGEHRGLWRHTEGQRRGIGIAAAHPLYVLRKARARNVLVVGGKDEALCRTCRVDQVNYMLEPSQWPAGPNAGLLVRTRYRQAAQPAYVQCFSNGMDIRFVREQGIPAPGQVAAVYDQQGYLLAGGIIVSYGTN
jgi:tRNA-specific 2-thiouridylase